MGSPLNYYLGENDGGLFSDPGPRLEQPSKVKLPDEDDFIDPQSFVPTNQRVREGGVAFVGEGARKPKISDEQRSPFFRELKAELLKVRPGFSCDWDTTSDAMLQSILAIEKGKSNRHFSVHEQPRIAAPQVDSDTQAKLLDGMSLILKKMGGFEKRLARLEKSK